MSEQEAQPIIFEKIQKHEGLTEEQKIEAIKELANARDNIRTGQRIDNLVCDNFVGDFLFSDMCDEIDNFLDNSLKGGFMTPDERKNGVSKIF